MNKIVIIALALCGLATSCSQDESIETNSQSKRVEVIATIGEAIQAKAANGDKGGMSYNKFEKGDKIGFYAQGGLDATNKKLTSSNGGSFANSDLQWTNEAATNVFAYFPYSENASQIDIWRETKDGKPWKAGFEDLLATEVTAKINEGTAISLRFKHKFAMLAITRGKGFDNLKEGTEKTMKITLNTNVTKKATITTSNTGYNITLTEDNSQDPVSPLETTTNGNTEYIILPVGTISDTAIDLKSITLKNNAGRDITIDYRIDNKDNGKTTGLAAGKIYNINVIMRDNQAVVDPAEIIQWDEEEIIIPKPKGISTLQNLKDWAGAYNRTEGGKDETKLADFGTKDNNGKWTFLLLEDLDFTKEEENDKKFGEIKEFTDIFDGQGHTITGFTIKEGSAGVSDEFPTGFVRTLGTTGIIKQLKLKDVLIYGKTNVGAFAGNAEAGATIENCQVLGNSIVYGTSHVGGIAGSGNQDTWTGNLIEPSVFVSKTPNE